MYREAYSLPVKLAFTYFIFYYVIPLYLDRSKLAILVLMSVVSFAIATLLYRVQLWGYFTYVEPRSYAFFGAQGVILCVFDLYITITSAVIIKMIKLRYKSQEVEERLISEKLQSELSFLRAQTNPHFLFNSLSILSSLVHVNADLSEQFIQQLSRLYRYILEQKDRQVVLVRIELDFLQSYIFLLKIRFENKFELKIRLDEADTDRYKIVPLTLQLLVENAVKHNQMSVKEPLVVEVFIENDCLVVKNRIHLRQHRDASTGTGLNSIINRYTLLSEVPVLAGEEQGCFVVRVPLLQ